MIDKSKWKWFGNPGHFICARDCRFHLCTQIGQHLVSTVGEYLPDSPVRESNARALGITLEGIGDARLVDWFKKCGYEDIGCNRKFETMVFRTGKKCTCGCGLPAIASHELDMEGYSDAAAATKGHNRICLKVAKGNMKDA